MGTWRRELFEHCSKGWPRVELSYEAWCAHLDARGWLDELERVPDHPEALFLCCACALGDGAAWMYLEREHFAYLRGVAAKVGRNAEFADEVLQLARERLFSGSPPKIASYTGHGHLRGWLRVVVQRLAIDQKRRAHRVDDNEQPLDELWLEAAGASAEGPALRSQYALLFARAAREVLHALPLRERTLLRLYFIEGANIDALGRMYGKDRSTAARWLQRCRENMQAELQRRIRAAIGDVNDTEFASLARFVESEIDLSVSALWEPGLIPPAPAPEP